MKTREEIDAIRTKTFEEVNPSKERKTTRILVGMGTCGLAAGAGAVFDVLKDEAAKFGLKDVTVVKTGCIGVCRLEPIVEVYSHGRERVTYVKMTPEKARRIVSEDIIHGRICEECVIGAVEAK